MTKYLFCNYELDADSIKLLKEAWKFEFYFVKMLEHLKRHEVFNYYPGISTLDKKLEYDIKINYKGGER